MYFIVKIFCNTSILIFEKSLYDSPQYTAKWFDIEQLNLVCILTGLTGRFNIEKYSISHEEKILSTERES